MPDSSRREEHAAPLIGRDEELALLSDVATSVRERGEARVVTLVGPNGVGKTRLIDQITTEIASSFRVFRGGAKKSTYGHGAFASLLRARFGIADSADPADAGARIRQQVSSVLEDRKVGDVCFFLGQVLDIPFADSPLTKAVDDDPVQGSLLKRAVIRNFFETDASNGALCLVFDDLDSAGDDSVSLVSHLVEHLTGSILVLCSTRPEMLARHPNWFDLGGDRHQRVDLGALGDEMAGKIMKELLAPCEGGPPKELIEASVRLASGNVGLLEAMVRIFRDSGVLSDIDGSDAATRWRVHLDKLSSVQLPGTVDDTVSMRIASLSKAERRVLEHGAVMGNAFWLGGLVALERIHQKTPQLWRLGTETELDNVEAVLSSLEQRDYVARQTGSSLVGEREYAFKHSLEREKLLALTRADARRAYHQAVADWLRDRESARSTREYTGFLAYHLDLAGAPEQAAHAYFEAGDFARESYASKDAQQYYARGLELLGESDAHRRIDALHNHGDVLMILGRTEQALGAFEEMLALAYRLDQRGKGGAAHNRIGRIYRTMGSLSEAKRHLETALELFDSVGDERGVAACQDDVGKLLWTQGEYEKALERMKMALETRKQLGDRRSIALSLHNIGVVWRDHGQPTQAREALEASLKIRREIGDLVGVAQTLNSMGRLEQDQRVLDRALDLFTQALDVAKELGEKNRIAVVLTNLGEVQYRLGDSAEAIRILIEAEALCDQLGDRLHLAEAKRGLAKAYLMQNELKKARSCIKTAVDLFGQVRSKSHLATALRTLGEITAAGAWGASHEGRAVDYFMRSIALCKEIGNEIEIAKSYRVFSDYVAWSDHYRNNAEIQREAKKLREMSDEIFERQRIARAGAEA